MECPSCHIPVSKLIAVDPPDERINEFGRTEIVWEAHFQQWIEWKDGKYHCNNCGRTFSFMEGVYQAFRDPKPQPDEQTKLASFGGKETELKP